MMLAGTVFVIGLCVASFIVLPLGVAGRMAGWW